MSTALLRNQIYVTNGQKTPLFQSLPAYRNIQDTVIHEVLGAGNVQLHHLAPVTC